MKHGPPPLSGTKQMLPGFVNSFTQSKGKEPAPQLFGRSDGSSAEDQAGFFSSHPSPPSSPTDGKGLPAGPLDVHMDSDDMEYTNDGGDGQDAVMGTAPTPTPAIGASQSEGPLIEEIEPPDWGYELQRIMFSHRARATATFTLQALIGVHLGDDATDITKASHHHACAAILRVLGSVPSDELLDDMLVAISGALLDLVEILTAVHASRALASLFNLLTVLICSLPSFISSLLMIGDGLPTPRALTVLCEAIRFHLDPSRSFDASHEDLLNELFIVLGLITLSTPDHLESSLMIFPRTPGVLDLLLDDRHPDWVLRHNTQLLVNLASRPRLFRYLLSFPGADAGDAGTPTDFSQLPHIERMCAYLTDSSRRGDMMAATRSCVLEFLALLSVAHEDARTILLQSHALIPSIIVFLTLLASMIWEEQEDMILNSTVAQSTARMLVQALNLLHYLVFASDPAFDLRQKLIQAAQLRPFNGLTHMFIVTLGRLSYADCPDWLEGDELEQGAETARELLDLVVEGPELDSVWAAFQPGDEDESFIDDEEQEARMLEANEI
ncbi:hypothetical protein PUNSTDRAFT_142206 [Punctularia strigosozonata HHB-11173 SS5]|uniref:uncharacterized protein n=1 Tax=Punctularia strigosozonata (strain HHB-11173) TaxID=741275 RepID=UPI0004416E0E|nr:uncharacterized protein PUNSTDRAFT_142206 [Punctularia strigosozonata HHB-11173 SS5]EIN12048.1 hypothetical protein PUNSTDRAFT_142206 [Punctularia strigosozonata HHB-11173 SS5]